MLWPQQWAEGSPNKPALQNQNIISGGAHRAHLHTPVVAVEFSMVRSTQLCSKCALRARVVGLRPTLVLAHESASSLVQRSCTSHYTYTSKCNNLGENLATHSGVGLSEGFGALLMTEGVQSLGQSASAQ